MSATTIPPSCQTYAHAIFALALSTPADVAAVFCEYYGHVNCFEVRVYIGGWKEGAAADFRATISFNSSDANKRIQRVFSQLTRTLGQARAAAISSARVAEMTENAAA